MGAMVRDSSPSPRMYRRLKGAESIHVQVLERHVHHGIEHVDVPPHTVGVQPTRQSAVPGLGDVNVAQFIQRQVANLAYK